MEDAEMKRMQTIGCNNWNCKKQQWKNERSYISNMVLTLEHKERNLNRQEFDNVSDASGKLTLAEKHFGGLMPKIIVFGLDNNHGKNFHSNIFHLHISE